MSLQTCTLRAIYAKSRDGVIGVEKDGEFKIPWHLPKDLAYFKELTLDKSVIMGRLTWESLPLSFRPLPGRKNYVMTRNHDYVAEGATVVHKAQDVACVEDLWVIGGREIYEYFRPWTTYTYVTHVDLDVRSDPRYKGHKFIMAPDFEGFTPVHTSRINEDRGIKFHHETCANY